MESVSCISKQIMKSVRSQKGICNTVGKENGNTNVWILSISNLLFPLTCNIQIGGEAKSILINNVIIYIKVL